jgi:co-chaperonin GroES (HSP10)
MSADPLAIDYTVKPAIPTQPQHHFCSVIERCDIEEKLHSSVIDLYDSGIKLDGRKNRARLVQVLAVGHGRWVHGGRQPPEVAVDQIVYVKERTVPFRLHLRKQNHFFVAMDAIMAELDQVNLKLRPVGQFIVTREVDERARVAVMGDLPFHIGATPGTDKSGSEADDIGCNKTRIEEVVAVGPGRFGGFIPKLRRGKVGTNEEDWVMENEPYWQTPDVKPGDLVVFTDMARPTSITLAGRKYTLFEYDHNICTVLDQAV